MQAQERAGAVDDEPAPGAKFEAFGCQALVAVSEPAALDRALAAVHAVVEEFDLACSRFRPDSELSALNGAAGATVAVSALLLEAVAASLRAARLTDGDVDPTVGGALLALGYDRDFEGLRDGPRKPAAGAIVAVPGWRVVAVDREAATITLPAGVTLDLGATAKALAADHAAAAAHEQTGCGVLVGFGGDFALAGEAPFGGWTVHVTDDHRAGPDAPGQTISLRTGALASSSITVRRWPTGRGWAHHLLDPGTGAPVAGPWRTVSVCAANCLDANIASTAAMVRGHAAKAWLEQLGLPARLVTHEATACHVAGWPDAGEALGTQAIKPGCETPEPA